MGGVVMRKEVVDKIMMILTAKGVNDMSISNDLYILLNDYDINLRETSIAVRNEDKNKMLFQKFLIAKTVKGCTERTIDLYRTEIWKIINKIGKSIDEIESDDIRLYLAIRQKRDGVTKTTANNELRYLRSFFSFLQNEELITKNPVAKIERIKIDKKAKSAFTELEVERIRNNCQTSLDCAIVEVLLSTGCRVTELVGMKINDLKGEALVVHGKGNKDRIVYLNARAIIAVENYLKDRKDKNEYMFPGGYFAKSEKNCREWYKYPDRVDANRHMDIGTVRQRVAKIGKRGGVEHSHPHKFRRTCATFALRRGMPIEQVSKMLGHEQISTTQIYLDLTEDDLKMSHKKYVV